MSPGSTQSPWEDSCPSPTSPGPESSCRGSSSGGSDSSPCPQDSAQGYTGVGGKEGRKCSQGRWRQQWLCEQRHRERGGAPGSQLSGRAWDHFRGDEQGLSLFWGSWQRAPRGLKQSQAGCLGGRWRRRAAPSRMASSRGPGPHSLTPKGLQDWEGGLASEAAG